MRRRGSSGTSHLSPSKNTDGVRPGSKQSALRVDAGVPAMASLSDLDSEDEARQSASSEARQSASPGAVHTEGSGVVSPTARWRGWWLRLSMTALMIAGCFGLVYVTRQAGVVLLIIALQTGIYRELVRIASVDSKERALPGFAYFYWYWFGVAAFFIYTWTLQPYLLSGLAGVPLVRVPPAALGAAAKPYWKPSLDPTADVASAVLTAGNAARSAALFVVQEYVPIGFALYCAGLIAFVFSLRQRRNFRYQFGQFAYCHVALLAVVFQSTFLSALVFNGLIWFFLPCGLVVCNDSCSYVAGFFFGRTPLIRLSPKKTVEGFVGGALATIVFSVVATGFWQSSSLLGTKYLMLCPVTSGVGNWGPASVCDTDAVAGGLFVLHPLSSFWIGRIVPAAMLGVRVSAMQLHACVIALFASIVAPFGGFFASGFKRTFRLKDFGNVIPGHGGFTDRMDCQLLMGTFAFVYANYFLVGYQAGPAAVAFHVHTILNSHLPVGDLEAVVRQLAEHVEAMRLQGSV